MWGPCHENDTSSPDFAPFALITTYMQQVPPARQPVEEVEGDTMTSLGALRATFTPPSSCTSDIYKFGPDNGYYFLLGPSATSDCFPSSFALNRNAYYSPGVCPVGYTEACKTIIKTETIATCCPRWVRYVPLAYLWVVWFSANAYWNIAPTHATRTLIDGVALRNVAQW